MGWKTNFPDNTPPPVEVDEGLQDDVEVELIEKEDYSRKHCLV